MTICAVISGEVKGCIITIDAMGRQTEIAEKTIEKQADYVLAAKGNQKHWHQAIIDYFDEVGSFATGSTALTLSTDNPT